MAIIPAIPALVQMKLGPMIGDIERFYATLKASSSEWAGKMHSSFAYFERHYQEGWLAINAVGNGFILTAMIWGAFTAMLIDRRFRRASVFIMIGALFSFFGLMHSVQIGGGMYLPWRVQTIAGPTPFAITTAYALLAALIYALSFTKGAKDAAAEKIS